MPTKFGLIWIGLRGLKIPDKKTLQKNVTFPLKLEPSQPSLAWVLAELSNSSTLWFLIQTLNVQVIK